MSLETYKEVIVQLYKQDFEIQSCAECEKLERRLYNDSYSYLRQVRCGGCQKEWIYTKFSQVDIRIEENELIFMPINSLFLCHTVRCLCADCKIQLVKFFKSLSPRSDEAVVKMLYLNFSMLPRELCVLIGEYSFQRLPNCPHLLQPRIR